VLSVLADNLENNRRRRRRGKEEVNFVNFVRPGETSGKKWTVGHCK
jgi:hypothetical protein